MKIDVYEIEPLDGFSKRVERLTRKKRFVSLPSQIAELIDKAEKGEFEGDLIKHADEPTPYNVYKLRLPNKDTNVGKSNGYRVIYLVATEKRIVVFLTIYYKKEETTVRDTYIEGLIDGYFLDISQEDDAENSTE